MLFFVEKVVDLVLDPKKALPSLLLLFIGQVQINKNGLIKLFL